MRGISVVALLLAGSMMILPDARAVEPEPAVAAEAAEPADKVSAAAEGTKPAGEGEESKPDYVTREDLDALKDILDEQIRRGAKSKNTINLSGFGIIGYFSNFDRPDSFGISSASLSLAGNLREDPVDEGDLKYKISLLFGGASPTALSSASLNQSGGGLQTNSTLVQSPVLSDVILIWDLKTLKGDLEPFFTVSATLGQQLVPFGQDNLATEDKIPTIKKAQYLGGFEISRDIGLKLEGGLLNRHDPASGITTPLISYSLAAFNGTGANRSDNNKEKDYVARLILAPVKEYFSFFRDLKFGGSYYHGRGNVKNPSLERERFGVEFEWLKKPILVTAEGVFGKDGDKHSVGYVATLFWTPGTLPDFQPLFRYDAFDPDTKKGKDKTEIYTVGFNYYFYQTEPITRRTYEIKPTERVVKLQVNYNIQKKEEGAHTANDVNAQLVFSF